MYQYTTTSFKLSNLVFETAPALQGASPCKLLPSLLHLSAPCGRSFLTLSVPCFLPSFLPSFLPPQCRAFPVVTYLLLPNNAKRSPQNCRLQRSFSESHVLLILLVGASSSTLMVAASDHPGLVIPAADILVVARWLFHCRDGCSFLMLRVALSSR
jgi:hypothetical protein